MDDDDNSVLFYGEDEDAELEEEKEENYRVDIDTQLVSSINKMFLKPPPPPKYIGYIMPEKSCLKSAAKREKSYLLCLYHILLQCLQAMFIS
eukprot:1582894-Ditylum_brightwellii.AAC.1